jgi:uncharacterized protein YdaU (DUF1376 family)
MIEHGAYTLLIDACYDRERFPTRDEAIQWCWARTTEEISAVDFVLSMFFAFEDGAYTQKRIKEEVEIYHRNASINKEIAIKREEGKRERARTVNEPPPNQEPITNNHKPIQDNLLSSVDDVGQGKGRIPYDEIFTLFNNGCKSLPSVIKRDDARKKMIRSIWLQDELHQEIGFWEWYFNRIEKSDFLTGRKNDFKAGFDWILKPSNFKKVIEGNYDNK